MTSQNFSIFKPLLQQNLGCAPVLSELYSKQFFISRATTRKHNMAGQKYFKGGERTFGVGQKYTKYNKISNSREVSGGKINAIGASLPSLVACLFLR